MINREGLLATKRGTTAIDVMEWLILAVDGMKDYRADLTERDQVTVCDLKIKLYEIAVHSLKAAAL